MTEVPTESELLELANQFHNEKLVDTSELIIQMQTEELAKIMIFGIMGLLFLYEAVGIKTNSFSFIRSIISKIKKYIPRIVWVKND